MNIDELFWDELNEEHISRHAVTREEVEDVCFSKNFVIKSGLELWKRKKKEDTEHGKKSNI